MNKYTWAHATEKLFLYLDRDQVSKSLRRKVTLYPIQRDLIYWHENIEFLHQSCKLSVAVSMASLRFKSALSVPDTASPHVVDSPT